MTDQVAPPSPGAPTPPPSGEPAPPPAAPAKSGAGKKILGIVGAIVVALVFAGIKFGIGSAFFGDKTAEAKVGDCIANLPETKVGEEAKARNVKVVECTATDAAYSVAGRLEDQTLTQARAEDVCEEFFEEGEEYFIYYSIPDGGKGHILCLREKA